MKRIRCGKKSAWLAFAMAAACVPAVRAQEHELPFPRWEPAYPESVLALDEIERIVLERNPTLESARQAVREAEAQSRQTGSFGDPMLEGDLAPWSLSSSSPRVGYGLSLRQDLRLFQRGPERSAANFAALAAASDAEAVAHELLRLARWAYADFAVAVRSREINEERYEILESMRRSALSRYAAGLVGAVDPLQAEAALAHVEHRALVLERQIAVAAARLNVLMHRSPTDSLPAPRLVEPAVEARTLDTLRTRALVQRPERQASEARIRSWEESVTAAGREGAPDLSFMLGYETYMDHSDFWPRVGLGVRLPLSFGRIGGQKDEARARQAMAVAERAAEENRIQFEVQDAHLRMREEAHQVEQFSSTWLPVRERALVAARAGYESGQSDLLVVLSAEEDLAMTRLSRLESLAEYHRARADLDRAVGGDAALTQEVSP